jgi:AI-2 transport system permease protein
MHVLKRYLLRWESVLILLLIAEIAIFGRINPRFLNTRVLLYSVNDFVCVSIISLFMAFVVITGGIDISGGSIIGLTSVVVGVLWKQAGLDILTASFAGLATGALCGAFNGFLVAFAGVQAMVVTLGGMMFFSGLALVLVGVSGVSAFEGISGFPDGFMEIAGGDLWGVPNPALIFAALFAVACVLLHCTNYGRRVFLVGINPNAARYSGLGVRGVVMSTYVLSGLGASIAGIVLTSYLGGARSDLGAELTLPIVTAVVLGGVSITGGRGTVVGVAIAGVVVGLLRFGLQMAGVSSQYITVGTGMLLVVSAAVRGLAFRFSLLPRRSGGGDNIKGGGARRG